MCVVDGAGKVVWQGKCASTPEAMVAIIQRRVLHAVRIALETGPMSAWHYRRLTALGLPVVCIDARHAKAALAMQLNKTDANDAVGLAQIVRTGWYREVAVKSEHSHRTRGLLAARARLVGMRKEDRQPASWPPQSVRPRDRGQPAERSSTPVHASSPPTSPWADWTG